ncbi:MAG: outer membrane beta-barrel protein [Bacteroidetes bacterium]|nr:outer membrane beta-barrel protein [Bacteroidota bacterium]
MKKLFLLTCFVGLALLSKAQSTTTSSSGDTYHTFKFDIGLGYAIPSSGTGNGVKAGVTFTLQPHYRLSDEFALGLRFEGAALGYQDLDSKTKVSLMESYCPTGEYYLMNGGFRPFIGAGAGLFAQSSLKASNGNATLVPSATNFGFFPEIGFEAGHFRLSADYDVAGNSNNYLAFKIGAFFGGGKK